jgi:hypothetical protein
VGQITPGAEIGFNVGGAQASQASLDAGNDEAAYGYFSWQALSAGSAGGDVMNNAASFATLNLLGGGGGTEYGVGVTVEVPSVDPAVMVMDGVMDEPKWDIAPTFDPLQFYNFYTDFATEPDLEIDARAMYAEDTLYVFVTVYDNEIYQGVAPNEWDSDQILIGVDGTHAGDDQVDDNYSGWPLNIPDLGPTTYKISPAGITHNWGYDGNDPVADGYVRGTVFQDETTLEWGVEMAIYVGQITPGAEIGFNVGGAQASQASLDAGNDEAAYGYFSWQALSNGSAGGDVMNNAASFATLKMQGGGGGTEYGVGVTVNVPQADPAAMVMDGEANEAIWAGAPSFDFLSFYNFYTDFATEPDLEVEAKAVYATDTLYVYAIVYDNEIYQGVAPDEWDSDQILIGVDGTHAGDDQVDDNYSGWPLNIPDLGPTTYKISPAGITHNWGYDGNDPVADGFVRGTVFQDEVTLEWGVEMAIYVGQIEPGADIGFNIGGAQASQASLDAGNDEAAYGYFSWQALSNGSAGGDVMNNAASFATLHMEGSTAIEEDALAGELPSTHALHQNYPNPFNPQTTIGFDVKEVGHVRLDVFNLLGQRVASLVDGRKAAGRYEVTWDAAGLTSGVYLARLRVGDAVVGTKRLTLMK